MADPTFKLIWWVFALPIFGFLFQCLAGKAIIDALGARIGRIVVGVMACAPIFAAFGLAVRITAALVALPPEQRVQILTLFEWVNIAGLSIPFEFRVDTLSMTMTLIITGIGALIHLYATGYMSEEKDFSRFFTYLNLFIAAMLVLVLGNNLVLLFMGWEGVGVCSYLLIGFWYKDLANSKAANKAFITNRIGDFGLTIGIFMTVFLVATSKEAAVGTTQALDPRWLSYDVFIPFLVENADVIGPVVMFWLCVSFFVGAMGKSAQFPLYVWLPDAMAGPTPVSALIHAATMVTSGVFLLNRMGEVFLLSPAASVFVAIIGAITALLGAAIAFGQTDIKKVLAFSTVSQLGYMFIACGVGAPWVGLFHVITHAFFKALLFLGSGAVIHAMAHEQDMRRYGNLKKYIPITFGTMMVGWLAIAGFPFLAGFFSKEEILHAAFHANGLWKGIPVGPILGGVALLVAVMTAAYMTRMTMMTFYSGAERWKALPVADHHHDDHGHDHHGHDHHDHGHHDHGPDTHDFFYDDAEMARIAAATPHEHHHELDGTHKPHEVPWMMWVPLAVLAIASIFGGAWLLKGLGLEYWLASEVKPDTGPVDFVKMAMKYIQDPIFWGSLVAAGVGMAYGWFTYGKSLPAADGLETEKWHPLRKVASKQFYVDQAFTDDTSAAGRLLGRMSAVFDIKVIDGLVIGLAKLMGGFGEGLRSIQTGFVRHYAVLMQIGIVGIIAYVVYIFLMRGGR